MELVKVRKHYQMTIPQSLRKLVRFKVGDYVAVEVQDDALVIKPVTVIHPGQEYFYTREWQAKEAEADRDLAAGDVAGPFASADDALKALKQTR